MLTVLRHDTYVDPRTGEERVAFHMEVGKARTYEDAWNVICHADTRFIRSLSILDRALNHRFSGFEWPDGVNYVYYNDNVPLPVVPPSSYDEASVLRLIDEL